MNRKELVDKMQAAYLIAREGLGGKWAYESDELTESRYDGMDAALSVAIEELLSPVTDKEFHDAEHDPGWKPSNRGMETYNHCLKLRKLERVKTPEERVTVEKWIHDPDLWIVLDNGANMAYSAHFADKKQAEIYRLGLIQQLKESNGR
jgi:hypothetical protein